ncbi:hypothetical protein BDW62DRAFT_175087 [Aspergillus aurantiobrunneus]
MLSQVERFLQFPARMDIRIHFCREPPTYTDTDAVAGHVILTSQTQVDIASISVKLSGSATSRLHSGRLTESHQLFKTTEQLFPPSKCANSFTSRTATFPPGEHVFPFSIKFPQATQCYKLPITDKHPKRKNHLMHKLPPSTGDKSSPAEIKYVLEATIRQDDLIRGTRRATKDINLDYTPTTLRIPSQQTQTVTKRITCRAIPETARPQSQSQSQSQSPSEILLTVNAKLHNGSILSLGQPIPLAVEITSSNTNTNRTTTTNITLHDFQSMLLETTKLRAPGAVHSSTRSWVVQTMANLRHPFVRDTSHHEHSSVTVYKLDNSLWSRHYVPLSLAPTFETCNIARAYELEVRLGIGIGGCATRIVEFRFPVPIVSGSVVGDFPALEMSGLADFEKDFEVPGVEGL